MTAIFGKLTAKSQTTIPKEVREALGARGTELVILIEDFAKLQGIDMQLLEAVIARPNQAASPGCRWK